MTLDLSKIGTEYTVAALDLPEAVGHRLEAIGMTRGAKVQVLGQKRGGALILKVRGARFALGRGIARGIEVA